MRPYEVMLIFDASLEEETIRAAVDRYAEFIRSRGGNPGRIDRWGKSSRPGSRSSRSCTGCSPLPTKSSATR